MISTSLTKTYRDGDMVLVDGGGVCISDRDNWGLADCIQEIGTYISDITRTWPVNGKFTDAQRDLYNAVLNVHRSCVSLCRESAGLSLDRLHTISENGLRDQLKQLGFDVSGDVCPTCVRNIVGDC
jgi:intermediate cleaving peptidase 55